MPSTKGSDRASQAYRRLRELIVHGRLAPGARVIETEVADKLGLSRTPVRAALQRLQQEGYILSGNGSGRARPVVAPLTVDDVHDLFSIVGEIEGLGAKRGAELPMPGRDALCRQLQEINDRLGRLAESGSPLPDQIFELDMEFHHTYVHAAPRPRLRTLHEAVKPQAERYIRLHVHVLVSEVRTSVEEHQAIVDAIRGGVAARAQGAVQEHWSNAAERVGNVLLEMGAQGTW